MKDEVVVKLGGITILGLVGFGILSFGLVPLMISMITKSRWVKVLDREGITLRNGRRLKWADLSHVERAVVEGGMLTVRPIQLYFGADRKQVAQIVPRAYRNRREILEFLGEVVPPRYDLR